MGDDYSYGSPFADVDAQQQPIDEQLDRQLGFVQEYAVKLREVEDAINQNITEVWDSGSDPIYLHLQPPEKVDVQDLIKTDNELFNKVLTVLAVLCDEISELKITCETNFYPAMIMFGQAKHGDEEELKDGDEELQMGRMLPFFQDLANVVDRCNSIVVNMIHQLASLHHSAQKLWKSTFKHVHLIPVYHALGELLEVLITLDAIVVDNPAIASAWDQYKRMMQYVRAEPSRYGIDEERVRQFERLLVSLDQSVMSGAMLQSCIEQDFEVTPLDDDGGPSMMVDVRNNKVFLEEFMFCIKDRFLVAASAIGTPTETFERHHLVGAFGLYVLYRRLTPPNILPDAKFYRRLWSVQKKCPLVTLIGRVVWFPSDFLLRHAPFATKKLDPKDVPSFRREFVKKLDENFPLEVKSCYAQMGAWLVGMESHLQSTTRGSGDVSVLLQLRGQLLLTGQLLALRVHHLVHTMMNLHLSLGVPMTKRNIHPLRQCIEILKAIEAMFSRKGPVIAESMALCSQQYAIMLHNIFRPLQAKLEASKRFDDTKLDILAAVTVLDHTLRGSESMSYTRQTVVALALRVVLISNIIKETQAEDALGKLWKISLCSDWQRKMRIGCDCTFLYWSREILSTFLADIYAAPEQAMRLPYVIAAFGDAAGLLGGAQHEADNTMFQKAYEQFIEQTLDEEIIQPLCTDIENDLRLHVHSVHLDHMSAPNPKQSPDPNLLTRGRYLGLAPIRLFGTRLVSIKLKVLHYLETTFYNLTTVALHDWKTYGEMRNLAYEKYGLDLMESHLPMGSLDQGLDILQIMRKIHLFVSRYNYNLNQQTFLERRSDKHSKHLNSINIQSVASSIRTHGMGMMNTTVNFTYHFLRKKFSIFSQFLFDEYIKSYVARERRWFKKHKDDADIDQRYPYQHAFQFNKAIRKLGVDPKNGRTFLDQFRILITEIGNALGYVRMVRSAGMHYCSNAIRYVPDLDKISSFEEMAGKGTEETKDSEGNVTDEGMPGADLSPDTVEAAKNLDAVIGNLCKNFSDSVDYFKILVDVFRNELSTNKNTHLANFYMIIPALTVNFVEQILQSKDLMYKSHRKKESYFSDDGFAIGVAYILAILDQGKSFDSLHWFETVTIRHQQDMQELKKKQSERIAREKNKGKKATKSMTEQQKEEDEIHTLQLTAKRIEQHKREFDLLFFSFSGARIFFKQADEHKDDKDDATAPAADAVPATAPA